MLKKLEERLFWFLEARWRNRATVDDIVRQRQWLILDITTKGGTAPRQVYGMANEARELLNKFRVRLEGPTESHAVDERVIALLKTLSTSTY